jgi:thioredoxin 2
LSSFVTARCAFCQAQNRIDMTRATDRPTCGECHRPFLLDRPVKVTAEDFARTVLEAEIPVLVDFHADWCGPCKVMAPVLDEVARETTGEVLVAKVDTDRAPEIAQRYDIRGIPTVVLFQDGKDTARLTGAVPKAQILSLLAPVRSGA